MVQWLGFLAFTQAARVRFPVWERFWGNETPQSVCRQKVALTRFEMHCMSERDSETIYNRLICTSWLITGRKQTWGYKNKSETKGFFQVQNDEYLKHSTKQHSSPQLARPLWSKFANLSSQLCNLHSEVVLNPYAKIRHHALLRRSSQCQFFVQLI